MLTRRRVVSGLALLPITSIALPQALAQVPPPLDDDLPPLPELLKNAAAEEDFQSPTTDIENLGTADPGPEKKKIAAEIMRQAPYNCRPIDVANFYRRLGLGTAKPFGEKERPYARGWPREYNPIIIAFFKTTGLNPLAPGLGGDDTAWCAAFVNYCIARSRCTSADQVIGKSERQFGTNSASSGSFRCFGKELAPGASPKVGDIAVWALEGTISGCSIGQGHVGFYDGPTGDTRKPHFILGGNQSGDLLKGIAARKDGIIRKAFPLAYLASENPERYKRFLTFRTADFL